MPPGEHQENANWACKASRRCCKLAWLVCKAAYLFCTSTSCFFKQLIEPWRVSTSMLRSSQVRPLSATHSTWYLPHWSFCTLSWKVKKTRDMIIPLWKVKKKMDTPKFCEGYLPVVRKQNTVQQNKTLLSTDSREQFKKSKTLSPLSHQMTLSNCSMYLFFQSLNFMLQSAQLLPQLNISCWFFLKYANVEMCKFFFYVLVFNPIHSTSHILLQCSFIGCHYTKTAPLEVTNIFKQSVTNILCHGLSHLAFLARNVRNIPNKNFIICMSIYIYIYSYKWLPCSTIF